MVITYLQDGDSAPLTVDIGQGINVGVTYVPADVSLISVSGNVITSKVNPVSNVRTYVLVKGPSGTILSTIEVVLVPSQSSVVSVENTDASTLSAKVIKEAVGAYTRVGPNPPTGLAANVISSSEIDLTWAVGTNDSTYNIYRGGLKLGTSSSTSFSDRGLTTGTTYTYTVTGVNSSGIESGQSTPVSATTL